MIRHWREMSARQLSAGAARTRVAVLPLAATEAHGPHLPVGTDAMIGDGLVRRAASSLRETNPALFLPQHEVGVSIEHEAFAGTASMEAGLAADLIVAMGEAVARVGCRRLVLVTSHGGNRPVMDIAARRLRRDRAMLVACTAWEALGDHRAIYDYASGAIDIHGGERETSLMLAIRPDLVDWEQVRDFPSAQSDFGQNAHLAAHSANATLGWASQDLNPRGVVGDASAATATKGEMEIASILKGFATLIEEVATAPLPDAEAAYPTLS